MVNGIVQMEGRKEEELSEDNIPGSAVGYNLLCYP
jgi:hypothetical protein